MTDPEKDVWQREIEVLWRRSGASLVLKSSSTEEIVAVDGTGCDVWDELEQPATLVSIADRLSVRYGVAASQVVIDLEPVLDALERRRLVRRRPA